MQQKSKNNIKLKSGNEDYIKRNLEFLKFIQDNNCKIIGGKDVKKK